MTPTSPPGRPRRFDLIAFDWDGTLFDSTAIIARCIQLAVGDAGGTVPSDEDASYVIGLGLMQALAHAAPDVPKEKYPLLGERYKHHYSREQDQISLFPGVLEMLVELKASQYFLTVATGKSRWGLNQALAHVDLKDLFHASRTADETAGKPHPRMLHELMAEMGVSPERTLMVGDTTHDLQLAANAGCASVGVNYGAHDATALAALGPLYIADSAQALHRWMLDNA
jgi:phosphoglycolate phosphatase